MKKILMTFAAGRMVLTAFLCCMLTAAVLTACSDSDDSDDKQEKPVPGLDIRIVGNWCSNVSGKTYARWNYGETWQMTEFKADGTGSTCIYYTSEGKVIGREKIDFSYSATADGRLAIDPTNRDIMRGEWQMAGDELIINDGDGVSLTFKKTTSDMAAQFETWDQSVILVHVPKPTRYTVFVYGNAGGTMDNIIEEGFWEKVQEFLTDHDNVRVVCLYKYGKDDPEGSFSGKYANPGDIVWFELNNKTDLTKIKEEGMQAIGMGQEAIELKICNPRTLKMFMEFSSLVCPAKEYIFGIWGHGSGFSPMSDVPGKYDLARSATRGVMYDEWNNSEELDMYELHDAIKAAGFDRLNTLFFHNCMMGNLETQTEVVDCADYICCSAHVLTSGGEVLTEFVRGLVDRYNTEDAVAQMFEKLTPDWQNGYKDGKLTNGDFKMFRTSKFEPVLNAIKKLTDHLLELYPTQKEAIDRATKQVYRVEALEIDQYNYPFFDPADYAHLLAKETNDSEMKAIATELDNAFNDAFIHYRDVSWCKEHLDHYTLSICLLHKSYYTYDYKSKDPSILSNFDEGYEQCTFHKYTGWGNWLRTNSQSLDSNPQNGGGGPIE